VSPLLKSNTKEKEIQVAKSNYKPKEWEKVKIRPEGKDRATVIKQEKRTKTHIKKISKTHYEVLSTGEIKEYKENTVEQNKKNRRQSLRRTFDQIKAIIRANFVNEGEPGCNAQVFMTLTYAENMTDEKRLYSDFDKFWKRLTYHIPGLEYLSIAEPQERGAWHLHVMIKKPTAKLLYIDYNLVAKLWPHGYSMTERLKSNDIGNYYIAYFTGALAALDNDHSLPDGEALSSEEIYKNEKENPSKSVVKGMRLGMYPKNFRFYRRSRGMTVPQYEEDLLVGVQEEYYEVESTVRSYDLIRVDAETNSVEILNRVYKAEYKRRIKSDKEVLRE
jgi:hypothetical protein